MKHQIQAYQSRLIQNDIKLMEIDSFNCPSIEKMENLEMQLIILSEMLRLFLQPLLKTEKRVKACGQSIVKLRRPKSGVMPFNMKFALQLDHRVGSKWLIEELHDLGF